MLFGLPEPIDERNVAVGHIYTISPTLINEIRFGYQRRNDRTNAVTANQDYAGLLGIPGVGPQTFPGFVNSGGSSVNFTANPGASARTLNENINIADNMTKVVGLHTLNGVTRACGKERTISRPLNLLESTIFRLPAAAFLSRRTREIRFASFELGAVTSASFTTLLANYIPYWYLHQAYVQDDWRLRRGVTLSLGVRYSYETPTQTGHGQKSNFDPLATDPLTGLPGAIVHPKGTVYASDKNNFTPRIGLAYNFRPNWVFRGSFGMFTADTVQTVGQDEYMAQAVVQQQSGSPLPAFYLSQGPGPITYKVDPSTGTSVYAGSNLSQRNVTYIDPHLRNPYTMNYSGSFQWEFRPNYLAELIYQGSSGVGPAGNYEHQRSAAFDLQLHRYHALEYCLCEHTTVPGVSKFRPD